MKNLFGILMLVISLNASATDSFVTATKTLRMDSVIANGIKYDNVVLQLTGYNLVSIGTSTLTPTNTNASDIFNTATGSLTLYAVIIDGTQYNNVVLNLSSYNVLNSGAFSTATSLQLGDGNVSTAPKTNYVYACQTQFNGRGSNGPWPWISGSAWLPQAKPAVNGSVMWPAASINISVNNGQRIISANNLPTHATGIYPLQATDPASAYDSNPNPITAQNILLTLPANPQIAAFPSCLGMGPIGFTLTGAAVFNALDAVGRDAPAHEVQDNCQGHPQQNGQYHYHTSSKCFNDPSGAQGNHSNLVGYAMDGFGMYGLKGMAGKPVVNTDLDSCHGHTHEINWDGQTVNMYHYHFTSEYPYTIGCFNGTPSR